MFTKPFFIFHLSWRIARGLLSETVRNLYLTALSRREKIEIILPEPAPVSIKINGDDYIEFLKKKREARETLQTQELKEIKNFPEEKITVNLN